MTPPSVCIRFSGLTFRFLFPEEIPLPDGFEALLCEDPGQVDEQFEIRLLAGPLVPEGAPVASYAGTAIYRTKKGWLRIYSPLIAEDGCQVACLLCPDGKNILYYPASRWGFYSAGLRLAHLVAGEVLLLRHDAFLLHSSLVMMDGKTVLFSGPSGAGKSTQARLWEAHLGAKVLNGDRTVIMDREGTFYGGGSIWCGTSGIYHPEQAPIAGIFLVNQAPENSVRRLGFQAFKPLMTQITVNSWDSAFMEKVTELLARLMETVPIYQLNCRPDADAARLGYQTLFGKEAPL